MSIPGPHNAVSVCSLHPNVRETPVEIHGESAEGEKSRIDFFPLVSSRDRERERKPTKFTYLRPILSSPDPSKRITILRYIVAFSIYTVLPDFSCSPPDDKTRDVRTAEEADRSSAEIVLTIPIPKRIFVKFRIYFIFSKYFCK